MPTVPGRWVSALPYSYLMLATCCEVIIKKTNTWPLVSLSHTKHSIPIKLVTQPFVGEQM